MPMGPDKRKLTRLADDPCLAPYMEIVCRRAEQAASVEEKLTAAAGDLANFAQGHEHFGMHRKGDRWVFREWAPGADALFVIGDLSGWRESEESPQLRSFRGQCWRLPPARLRRPGWHRCER